jgi:hypothetical protein
MYALEKYNWSIDQYTVGETFHYFIYVMTKGRTLNEADKHFYCRNSSSNQVNAQLLENDLNENYLFNIE